MLASVFARIKQGSHDAALACKWLASMCHLHIVEEHNIALLPRERDCVPAKCRPHHFEIGSGNFSCIAVAGVARQAGTTKRSQQQLGAVGAQARNMKQVCLVEEHSLFSCRCLCVLRFADRCVRTIRNTRPPVGTQQADKATGTDDAGSVRRDTRGVDRMRVAHRRKIPVPASPCPRKVSKPGLQQFSGSVAMPNQICATSKPRREWSG